MTNNNDNLTISDIVLDIPDKQTPGYLKRQMVSMDHQLALMDAQKKVSDAQAEANKLVAKKDLKPADERKVYSKMTNAMISYTEALEKTILYILGFVKEPHDQDAARAVIMDLSEDDYQAILEYIRNGGETEAESADPTG